MTKRRKSKSHSRKIRCTTKSPRRKNRVFQATGSTKIDVREIEHRNSEPTQLPSPNETDQDPKSQFLAAFHPQLLGNVAYFCAAKSMSMTGDLLEAAAPAVLAFQERMRPMDALEELALNQALISHARAAWLSVLATKQTNAQSLAIINEAADRASSTFVRLTRAIREHRKPTNPSTTVSIGQANVAGQQIVQNIQEHESHKNHDEQTGIPSDQATVAEVVPVIHEGIEITSIGHPANATVDAKYGAPKPGGKGPGRDECVEARRKVSQGHRAAKIGKEDNSRAEVCDRG
jgi:hypothetical protein